MKLHSFTVTVEGIADDAHLDELVDAVNNIAYVSDIRKVKGETV